MSYNSLSSAKAITGVDLSQELLNEAQSIIHLHSPYRWGTTTVTDTLSSKDFRMPMTHGGKITDWPSSTTFPRPIDEISIFVKMPIQSVTSLTIGGTALTEDTDFEVREDIGEIRLTSFAFIGNDSITGTGDVVIVYTYGFTSSNQYFPVVQGVEARIALLLKNNPLLLAGVNLSGDTTTFANDPLEILLKRIPKPIQARALT